jgi:transcriptional regulator with XRE-family HTH domain
METCKTVQQLCVEQGIDPKQLADRTGLEQRRLRAIVEGRWTPSPVERDRLAAVFGLTRDQISWGHTAPVEHLYGHGPQFGRTP